jgi:glycosyltransferase involved in cell wall biosynthesis
MRALEPQLLHVAAEPPRLSVVAPLLNEEETLGPLYDEVRSALEPLGIAWEIVYVDDGSTDGSYRELVRLHEAHANVRSCGYGGGSARPRRWRPASRSPPATWS